MHHERITISTHILKRIQARATQDGCTVDALLKSWLDAAPSQIEEAQRKREALFRLLAENASDIIYRIRMTPEMHFEYVSPAVIVITGYTPEEHYANPQLGYKLVHPDDRHILQEIAQRAPTDPIVLRWVCKDGTVIWTEQRNTPIFDEAGNIIAIEGIARDITERKRMEEILREREARYRAALDASLDAFFVLESVRDAAGEIIDFRIVEVNINAVRQMAMPRETLIGGLICELFPINRTNGFFEQYKQVVESGEPFEQEYMIPAEHTAPGWYHHQVVPVGDGVAIVNQDISERKQTEQALRAGEARLRMTLQGTRAGLWEWNVQTGETIFDERWAAIAGYTLDELAPVSIQTWVELAHPDDLEVSNALLDKHFRGALAFYECEVRMKHKDGHWIWVLDRGKVMEWTEDGKPLRMFGTHIDVTERRQAAEALRASEELFRAIVDQSNDGIVLVDGDGLVMEWNRAQANITGISREQALHRPLWTVQAMSTNTDDPDTLRQRTEMLERMVRQALADEPVMWLSEMIETTVRHQDGTRHVVQSVVFPIDTDRGRMLGSIIRDITERKQVEKEREQLIADLDAFAHTVAHDLKSPITGILGFADMLAEECDERGKDVSLYLRRIIQSSTTMKNIIDELLLLSSVQHFSDITIAPVKMAPLIKSALERLDYIIENRSAQIILPDFETWPTALGYAPWIEEVWVNYLSNAVKYGGSDTEPPRVEIGAEVQDEAMVRFWVRDNGPGLTLEQQARLFSPFTRLDEARTEGHGLGLSIVRRIVEKFNGQVDVESVVGQGSAFSFTLPAAPTSPGGELRKSGAQWTA